MPQDEPQTLDQAIDSAVDQSESTVTEEKEVQTPETPESTSEPETPSEEESYTRIDPKTLPPELQAMHKSLLRDYTKKTQSIAQQRREIEELKQQLSTQPQVQHQAAQEMQVEKSAMQPHAGMSLEEYTAFVIAQAKEQLTQAQQQHVAQQEDQYLSNAVQEFEAVDERLNPESPAYDQYMRSAIGLKLDEALEAYRAENGSVIGFDYGKNAQDLIEQYDEYISARAQSVAQQRTKAAFDNAKRVAPLGAKSSTVASKPTGRMSIDDAVESAFAHIKG